MNIFKQQPSQAHKRDRAEEIRQNLLQLDRQASWYWWNAVLVITLLMGAIVVLSLPRILRENDPSFQLELGTAVRGLLGLVMIFNVYTLYQQHKLRVLRNLLADQMRIATEQQVRAQNFFDLATIDPLTGLYNRRVIEDRLRAEIARTERDGDPLTLLLLDLDNFKHINDHFGHPAGDLVLKEFARRIQKAIRASDLPVRMGGDEFLVLLPECPVEEIQTILSRLGRFEMKIDLQRVRISCSSGWAASQPSDTPEELIKRADEALYAHKAAHPASAAW